MVDRAVEAAQMLLTAYRSGQPIAGFPADLTPTTIDEAYAIQDQLSRDLGPVGAWKVGHGGREWPITIAPIFADRVYPSGVMLNAADYHDLALEVEFAFRLGADLPPRATPYGYDEVVAAIEGFCPCIEVVGSRFIDRTRHGKIENLADTNANGALICAGPIAPWSALDFATQPVQMLIDGVVRQQAVGTHPAGDPVTLVVWTANHLMARTGGLKAGQVVTTGSLDGATSAAAGQRALGTYGAFGTVEVGFHA